MPKLCDSCKALSEAPKRPDVPRTIRRVPIRHVAGANQRTFRYECAKCATAWAWTIGMGWHLSHATPVTLDAEILDAEILDAEILDVPAPEEARPRPDARY